MKKLIAVSAMLLIVTSVMAADGSWTGGGSDNLWTNTANWGVVPSAGSVATVDTTLNNPLVNMDVADVYSEIYIGSNSTDEVVLTMQTGGYLRQDTSSMFMAIAYATGSKARLDMTGGTISARDFLVGQRGSGIVNMSGGTMNIARNLGMGDRDGHGVSTFDLSGGTVDVGNWVGIGVQSGGMQTMTVRNSAYLETGNLSLGLNDGQGTLNIQDNGHVNLVVSGSRLRVGEGSGGAAGVINMDGGTLEVDSYIGLGYSAGLSGSMNLTDGDVTVNALAIGLAGDGDFDMSGGHVALDSHVRVGEGAGRGAWNMSGGLLEATNYVCVGWGTSAGETDLLVMTGGEIQTGELLVGRYGDGQLDLSDGVINLNYYNDSDELLFDTNGGDGTLDITGNGMLNWLYGNYTNEVNAFIASGDIINSVTEEYLNVVYDSGSNTTIVTAIPEPATLTIVAFVGGAMLWIRRRFMI